MEIQIAPVPVSEILPLRELHRTEMKCQIVHDSLHERGFTHAYSIKVDGETAGYGTVVGFGDDAKDEDPLRRCAHDEPGHSGGDVR